MSSESHGNDAATPAQPPATLSRDELATLQAVSEQVGYVVREMASVLSRWPAISLIAAGLLLTVLAFAFEVAGDPLTSDEYIATVVAGVGTCLAGAALEMYRLRQLREVGESGTALVPEAARKEIRRLHNLDDVRSP
jgi:hypothetical protein